MFEPRHAAPIRSGTDSDTPDQPDRSDPAADAPVILATIVAPASESATNGTSNGASTGASTGRRLRQWLLARSPDSPTPPTAATPDRAAAQVPAQVPAQSAPPTPMTLEPAMPDSPSDPPVQPVEPVQPAEPAQRRPAPRPRPTVRPSAPPADVVSPPPPPPPPPPRPFVRAGSGGATAVPSLEKPPAAAPEAPPTESLGANYRPDISRFLEASEPRAEDTTSDKKDRKAARRAAAQRTADAPVESDESPARPSFRRRHGKGIRRLTRYLVVVVILVAAAVALRTWVVQPFYIPSQSMEPTLHGCPGCNDDRVLVDKLSYRSGDVGTGDIVVFHRPTTWAAVPDKTLIKRVIGLPGDRIVIKSGFVYINGNHINEPYIDKACGAHPTVANKWPNPYVVPKGDVYVMGDNRCDSEDSRYFGPVPQSDIIGRAFMIVWPVSRITTL